MIKNRLLTDFFSLYRIAHHRHSPTMASAIDSSSTISVQRISRPLLRRSIFKARRSFDRARHDNTIHVSLHRSSFKVISTKERTFSMSSLRFLPKKKGGNLIFEVDLSTPHLVPAEFNRLDPILVGS